MQDQPMLELIRSNDPVVLSFAKSLLEDAGIICFVADENMSIAEGSIGIFAKRLMIDAERENQARRILSDAGIGHELKSR